jgi:microcystin-dependent protein
MTPTSRALALALALCACTGASAQQLWKWSQTPASNATADPAIDWATGMAPSAVSPSSRAMMAAVARYAADIAGRLTTSGTATAYTVTTNSGYAATPADGTRLALTFHATNGGAPTLSVDGGSAFPLNATTASAIPAATLVAGSPYDVVFDGAVNAWLVVGVLGAPTTIPLGGVIDYAGTSAPNSNFALCYGQAVSRTTYAGLFALIGTTFGPGDGVTTFNLPDLRGRVVAGVDNLGGASANRITVAGGNFDGTGLGNAGGAQNHTLLQAELPAIAPTGTISSITPAGTISSITPAGTISGSVSTTVGYDGYQTIPLGAGQTFVHDPSFSTSNHANYSGTLSATFSGTPVTPTFSGTPVTPTFSGSPIGSGNAHTILPPVMVLGKIIRVF